MRRFGWWVAAAAAAVLTLWAGASAASTQDVTVTVLPVQVLSITGGDVTFQFDSTQWSTDPGSLSDVSQTQTASRALVWLTNASPSSPVQITVQVDEAPPAWVSVFKVEVGTPTLALGSGSCGTLAAGGVDLGTTAQAVITNIYQKACLAPVTYSAAVNLDGTGTYAPTVTWTIGP